LGIIGDDESGKELISRLMTKEISPNIGKVTNNEQTFLADVSHKENDFQTLNELIIRTLSLSKVSAKNISKLQDEILALTFNKLSVLIINSFKVYQRLVLKTYLSYKMRF